MCVDYDELEHRALAHRAGHRREREGHGGQGWIRRAHGALRTVVSQPNFWMNHQHKAQVAPFAELLLAHGAHVNVRASLRKQLHPGYDEFTMHEYRNVTALLLGTALFNRKVFVSEPAMRLIAERGGCA
jgi:hypothetical protein